MPRLRWSFTATTVSTMRNGAPASCAVLTSASAVLGKAGAAEARPGMQEFPADALVEADAARDILHIGADLFAQIGDLVDEGDLGGEEAVGRVFDQLRRAAVDEERSAAR